MTLEKINNSIKINKDQLKKDPNSFQINFNLGLLYYNSNNKIKATKYFLKCYNLKKNNRETIINLSICLSDLNKIIEALMILRTYLDSNKNDIEIINLYNSIKEKEVYFKNKRNRILKNSNLKIKKFHNKHINERCVIIGNGPSLNKMDLSFLKNEITIGMNKIFLGFEKFNFILSYYIAVNTLVIKQCSKEINKLKMPKFIGDNGIAYLNHTKNTFFIECIDREKFSESPYNGLWEGYTVTFIALQIAYFMGFKEVILIGVDHNYTFNGNPNEEVIADSEDINHFHSSYFSNGLKWNLPDLKNSEKAYLLAKKYYENNNRTIIDATFKGKLNIFNKEDYKKIFK